MSKDCEACKSSKCPKKTAKKNSLRFELPQEETHKEKNKTKQTKQNLTRSFCCWLNGCETKTHGKLAVIITCGWRVGFCYQGKIFKRQRIWGGTTFVTLYNILHKSQLSLWTHPLHILCKQTKLIGEYKKHHWNYMQLCQLTTGLCFSFCSSSY